MWDTHQGSEMPGEGVLTEQHQAELLEYTSAIKNP